MRIMLTCAAMALLLAGCAQRPARPIETVQAHDMQMTCPQLRSEMSATRRMMGHYSTDQAQQSERNRQAVVGAVFAPVALMNMDTGNASEREVSAYGARLTHLESLSQQKACPND
jgi:PBP1b-binding outer membrane lipoprotein LpoB